MNSALAIDLGMTTGFALSHDGRRVTEHGVWKLATTKKNSAGSKLSQFIAHVEEVYETFPADRRPIVVWYRPLYMPGRHQITIAQSKMAGALELWCHQRNLRHEEVWDSTVKKFATGSGKAKKDVVAAVVQRKLPKEKFVDDNDSDATALLLYALHDIFKVQELRLK